jgi:hypothetical protein
MPPRTLALTMIIAVLTGATMPAMAQTQTMPSPPPQRLVPHRVEIYPRPLLYRRCTDWYELQHRPSGTVLYPQMHCWWVRG